MPHKVEEDISPVIDTTIQHGDWRDDLFRDGFAVVKGVMSPERAASYVERMFKWLETFPYDFDRNDPSTWGPEHLPRNMKRGMYHSYGTPHEDFVWDARTEPGVLEAYAKLWGTDELLVSFDGINFTLPQPDRPDMKPWPHIDQAPKRKGLICAQGIINFAPNGPQDGGLVVVRGSHNHIDPYFKKFGIPSESRTWGSEDYFTFTQEEVDWFKEQGCEVVKVCAGPGDLIIWDSRTIHYNRLPESQQVRSIVYACYAPVRFASEEDLKLKAQLFHERKRTTHWPNRNIFSSTDGDGFRLGKPDACERVKPLNDVVETDTVLRLAGVKSY
ncbi:hypothetical protein PV08_09334 [Exophiala spinifera]|uniref:Phytanoyl-CoA dioxygenase n=1 Tax=Exophiala spinifera TaxID=91928 RepID=A0A0D2B053_9EURO|nr:uncharacterized protein PV08_09334 [Exophiala spinifera]KIW12060.1 hypothetical protein PV08_09334 [Exophiala spinifera]